MWSETLEDTGITVMAEDSILLKTPLPLLMDYVHKFTA